MYQHRIHNADPRIMPAGSRLYTFGVVPLAPQDLSHPRIAVGLSPTRIPRFGVTSGWPVTHSELRFGASINASSRAGVSLDDPKGIALSAGMDSAEIDFTRERCKELLKRNLHSTNSRLLLATIFYRHGLGLLG
jgi:hypothetical protein